MDSPIRELIVYACPIGDLAKQIELYFELSRYHVGLNPAHAYMPHCSLTGFFHDHFEVIPFYISILNQVLIQARSTQPDPVIQIQELILWPEFHGLALQSDWIKQVIIEFARQAPSATRRDDLRPKDWLHLSLAYEFGPDQAELLTQLAQAQIDLQQPVGWELRFYERHRKNQWTCHACWPL